MSRQPRVKRQRSTLSCVLRAILERAAATPYGDRVALYLVRLGDRDGFALAERVHERVAGPDPRVLRERAFAQELREPFMPGAAPVEMLARILETLGPNPAEAALRAWAVRASFAKGEVPVVIVHQEGVTVTTLCALGEGNEPVVPISGAWFEQPTIEA